MSRAINLRVEFSLSFDSPIISLAAYRIIQKIGPLKKSSMTSVVDMNTLVLLPQNYFV